MMESFPIFTHEDNIITAKIETEYGPVYGQARCNPQDRYNKNAGERIAYFRAFIKVMKLLKRHELMPHYESLKHIYDIYEKNPQKYNIKSPEVALIRHQMNLAKADVETASWYINDAKEQIKFIDEMYNKPGQTQE